MLILPAAVSEERKVELEKRVSNLYSIIEAKGMLPHIERTAGEVAHAIEHPNGSDSEHYARMAKEAGHPEPDWRIQRIFKYLDDTFVWRLGDRLVRLEDEGAGHSKKKGTLLMFIAIKAYHGAERPDGNELRDYAHVGYWHDIGKAVPQIMEVLAPGTPLRDSEFEVVRLHPLVGYMILYRAAEILDEHGAYDIPNLRWVADIIAYHHEDYDGGGYPFGLSKEEIPWPSRLTRLVDAILAIARDRKYEPRYRIPVVCEEVYRCAVGAEKDPNDTVLREGNERKLGNYLSMCNGLSPEEMLVIKIDKNTKGGRLFPATMLLEPQGFSPRVVTYQEITPTLGLGYLREAYLGVRSAREGQFDGKLVPLVVGCITERPSLVLSG